MSTRVDCDGCFNPAMGYFRVIAPNTTKDFCPECWERIERAIASPHENAKLRAECDEAVRAARQAAWDQAAVERNEARAERDEAQAELIDVAAGRFNAQLERDTLRAALEKAVVHLAGMTGSHGEPCLPGGCDAQKAARDALADARRVLGGGER